MGYASKSPWVIHYDGSSCNGCDIEVLAALCPGFDAERFGVPCYLFYDAGKTQLSAMLTGDPYFRIYPYRDAEEIFPILDRILRGEEA